MKRLFIIFYCLVAITAAGLAQISDTALKLSNNALIKKPVITTVAGLRRVTNLPTDINYQTTDKGGGQWYYDSTDVSSPDNTGTVIVSGTKRLKRIFSGPLDVNWFGDINSALSSAGSMPNAILIAKTETLTANITIPANVTLEIQKGGSINTAGFNLTINGTFKAGRYHVFSGAGAVTFGPGSIDAQYPEWDGAMNDNTNSAATTHAFAIQYTRNVPISLGIGTYLVDSIAATLKDNPLMIFGQTQRDMSVIQLTPTNKAGISIGVGFRVLKTMLKDFTLLGTPSNAGGIKCGSDTKKGVYAAWVSLDNLAIKNFTGEEAYGISLATVQELHAHNCILQYNYNNVYRPKFGYCTSTLFDGKDSHIGYAKNRGISLLGHITDITFRDVLIELNTNEGIYYNSNNSSLFIINCYFEANSKGGTGTVSINGDSASKPTVKIIRCSFSESAGTVPGIYLKNIASGLVSENSIAGAKITVGSNVNCTFRDNAGINSQSMLGTYTRLRYSSNQVTAEDIDLNGSYFHVGDITFKNNVIINPMPTGSDTDSLVVVKNGVLKRVLRTNAASSVTKNSTASVPSTLADGSTITWDLATAVNSSCLIAGNRALVIKNAVAGMNGTLIIQQDGKGNRKLTYPANVKWENGTAPTLTSTPGAIDMLTFYYNGTSFFFRISKNYK